MQKNINEISKEMNTVTSLFCGCGGADLGLKGDFTFLNKYYEGLPFKTVYANDIDARACETFENNLNITPECMPIEKVDIKKLSHTDILIGGFPCQDFSIAGFRKGLKNNRGNLYLNMIAVAQQIKPKVIVCENVKGLLSIHNGEAIKKIIERFTDLGYIMNYKTLTFSNYGVPQKRQRVLIIGILKEYSTIFDFNIIDKSSILSAYDAIKDLEKVCEGNAQNHYWSKSILLKNWHSDRAHNKNFPAPTVLARRGMRHYNTIRRISVREAARYQSFPDNFICYKAMSTAYVQIGNAIPPVFAWHLGKAILKLLNKIK